MKKQILMTLALLLASSSALASGYSANVRATVAFQFDRHAFGKDVASVFVHTGLAIESSSRQDSTWMDVQNIPMVESRNGFFGKAILDGFYSTNSGGGTSVAGIWAQYWVTFTDGSKMTTQPVLHYTDGTRSPVWVDHSGARINGYRNALIQLIRAQNASTTSVILWSHDSSAEVKKTDAELASYIRQIRNQ